MIPGRGDVEVIWERRRVYRSRDFPSGFFSIPIKLTPLEGLLYAGRSVSLAIQKLWPRVWGGGWESEQLQIKTSVPFQTFIE